MSKERGHPLTLTGSRIRAWKVLSALLSVRWVLASNKLPVELLKMVVKLQQRRMQHPRKRLTTISN